MKRYDADAVYVEERVREAMSDLQDVIDCIDARSISVYAVRMRLRRIRRELEHARVRAAFIGLGQVPEPPARRKGNVGKRRQDGSREVRDL